LDEFSFRFDLLKTNAMTKRNILLIIARLYDILGLLGPVVIRFKLFVQEQWMSHLDCDEILPEQLIDRWQYIYPELHNLNKIAIPRYVRFSPKHDWEIHGFADASQRASYPAHDPSLLIQFINKLFFNYLPHFNRSSLLRSNCAAVLLT